MDTGERIRKRREELGMTQDELAQQTGYRSRSSINKIEKGGTELPQNKIAIFAKALDTTPSQLMGWEDWKSQELFEENCGGRLKALLEKSGYSQKEFAKKLDITEQTLTSYEKNEMRPNKQLLEKMLEIFDISLKTFKAIAFIYGDVEFPEKYEQELEQERKNMLIANIEKLNCIGLERLNLIAEDYIKIPEYCKNDS